MTTIFEPTGTAHPRAVRELWRQESVRSVWLRPGDWYHPAVDALAEAVLGDCDTRPAAVRLGEARGRDGVGIGESIDDLGCLYRAIGTPEPPLDVVRALCSGWSDASTGAALAGTCLDAESGLPTREYLTLRLAESYAVAEVTGQAAPDSLALVVVDAAAGQLSAWARIARSASVGAAVVRTCTAAHPSANLGGGVFAVLARRDAQLGAMTEALRGEIHRQCERLEVAQAVRNPVRVWTEPLPATHAMATSLLTDLSRA